MMTREQFLLIKLAEEASEIAQIALKTAQFGQTETKPGDIDNNAERVHGEINDLLAIVSLLNEEVNFGFKHDYSWQELKKQRVEKYYQYSKSLGTVK